MTAEFEPVLSAESYPWYQVWFNALTKPTVQNYEELTADPNASATKAYLWIFITSILGMIISFGFQSLFTQGYGLNDMLQEFGIVTGRLSLLTLFCATPFLGLLSVLFFIIGVGITQWLAGLLGGQGSFPHLAYAIAAYSAPLTIVSSFLGFIPIVNCLTFPLGLYGIFLNVTAVKAVNQFDWGKAVIAALAIPLILFFFFICVFVVLILAVVPFTQGTINTLAIFIS